jgi:CheY-like chemotaxis protein
MINESSETLTEMAEGTAENRDEREPPQSQKTTTAPAVRIRAEHQAVTGQLNAIRMQAEGTESSDEHESKRFVDDETQPAKPQPSTQVAVSNRTDQHKPMILIVEDTEELAEVIQATLENRGMRVNWVSHGSKGIKQVKENTPDVLLLDIGLPDMTGWKMLEELREWKPDKDALPTVIVITAYGDPANRLIGKLQGIHSYLIKPFTSDEVEKVVQGALSTTG